MEKNKKWIFLLFAATVLLSGCNADDFLGIKPRGKEIASTYKHYNDLLNSMDMVQYGKFGEKVYSVFMSDEFYSTPASLEQLAKQTNGPQAADAYYYRDDIMRQDEGCGDWGYNKTLYTYNLIIGQVMQASGGTEAEKLSVQSEARVMRAWLHFCTAQYFCKPYNEKTAATDPGLPIVKEANTNATVFKRGTLKELYEFVLEELEESCPNIQNETNYLYRTEKADAYAMLGIVYFFMNRYDKALTNLRLAKQYADENGASFLYNFNDMTDAWVLRDPSHWGNKEFMRDLYYNVDAFNYYTFSYVPATIYVKEKYFNLFSKGDRRRKRFVMEKEDEDWRPARSQINMGPTSPELYVTLAECEAREGDPDQAKALLYELRKNRMPEAEAAVPATVTDKNSLIRFCVEERIREQLGTGKFWSDMRRLWNDPLFQDYKAQYAHPVVGTDKVYTLTEERLVMRIPPVVMQWNDWQDNE